MPQESKPSPNPAIEGMSFEAALKELESIVERFESGTVSLDDAVAAYARGTALKDHCQKRLDEAKMRVDAIRTKQNDTQNHASSSSKAANKIPTIDGTAPLDTTSGE